MFVKYSKNQIPSKKSIGKGSKGKKTADESQETIDVSKEFEPKPAKKKNSSKRRFKKKVTLSADENIISDDPDAALESAKSISQTEAEEAEAARNVHATHARIVTESVLESAKKKSGGRSSKSVVIQDTPKQEAADIMQALKECKKSSKRQLGTIGSHEGTSTIPSVPDESTIVSTTSSEGTGVKPWVPDEEKDITEEKVILEWGDEQDSEFSDDANDDVEKDDKDGDADDEGDDHVSDTQDADDEDVKTESDEDEIYKYKIRVCKDEDEKMINAEVDDYDKGNEEITDAAKADDEKTSEAKDDAKKIELPPSSSSLYVSSGFGDQFLKLSSDSSLVSIVKDFADIDIMIPKTTNLPPIPEILTETPVSTTVSSPQVTPIISSVQQTPTPIPTQPITTDAPTIMTVVAESNTLTTVKLRVAKLEKDVSELKTVDHSTKAHALLKSQVPTVVDSYLDTKVKDVFQKEVQKHMAYLIHKYYMQHLLELTKKLTPTAEQESEKSPSDILKIKKEQAEKQKKPQFTIKSTDKAALEEYDLKSALYQSMHANKKHDDHEDDDNEDPPARPNQGKKTKRRRTKESESSKKPSSTKETPKGKTPTKGSRTGKSASEKESVAEPIAEVVMDDVGDDVAHDDNQPQDTSEPKTRKTMNPDMFKQPPRPPTSDLEWNKRQVILDQPTQPWFNQMVSAIKDPLTFNDLMATPIDFSKYVLNGLKIENLTQDILLGPAFNLLKGPPGHQTIAADYFFNNDLEYLKNSDPEVTYTSSITKTKAARYEIKGIEDMVSKFSKQNVYSTKAILGVKSSSVKKLHEYGHLEEIVVKRFDQQLYKFKEGDFINLHLNDIEDMLLLAVQHKLFHLDESVIFYFIFDFI
ncbi:hypothetical protein Tco_0500281 [Tanacetum coccineum]